MRRLIVVATLVALLVAVAACGRDERPEPGPTPTAIAALALATPAGGAGDAATLAAASPEGAPAEPEAAAAEVITATEEVAAAEVTTATEEVAASEASTATEEVASAEVPTATEEVVAAEATTATEEVAAAEVSTATEEVVAAEVPTATEEVVAAEVPTATEEVAAAEVITATEEVASGEVSTATEEVAATDVATATEEVVAAEVSTATEEVAAGEVSTATEEVAAADDAEAGDNGRPLTGVPANDATPAAAGAILSAPPTTPRATVVVPMAQTPAPSRPTVVATPVPAMGAGDAVPEADATAEPDEAAQGDETILNVSDEARRALTGTLFTLLVQGQAITFTVPEVGASEAVTGVAAAAPEKKSDAREQVLLLPIVAAGDLDGDAIDETAVIVNVRRDGNDRYYLVAAAADGEGARQVAAALLGVNQDVVGLEVADGQILVTLQQRLAEGSRRASLQAEARRYALGDGRLLLAGSEVLEVPADAGALP